MILNIVYIYLQNPSQLESFLLIASKLEQWTAVKNKMLSSMWACFMEERESFQTQSDCLTSAHRYTTIFMWMGTYTHVCTKNFLLSPTSITFHCTCTCTYMQCHMRQCNFCCPCYVLINNQSQVTEVFERRGKEHNKCLTCYPCELQISQQ